ncbi:MAG: isoprenylcysteine carboxylmethyltransferase family protein [Deltaproteobacteria bacterium]|nr:isoprenylcysteine carboxylmethyltransferase family protein [Deltaproteobacteria bacterium]
MRNPIRLKNLKLRFALLYLLGTLALFLHRPHPLTLAPGVGLVVLGIALRGWGAGHLVKNERLTISGPYAHLRHPLYAGTLLVGVGFGLIAGGPFSLLLLALLLPWFFLMYFPRKERVESARLEHRYGNGYTNYRDGVPALIPSLRAWRPAPESKPESDHHQNEQENTWSRERYIENNELGSLIALLVGLLIFGLRAQLGS